MGKGKGGEKKSLIVQSRFSPSIIVNILANLSASDCGGWEEVKFVLTAHATKTFSIDSAVFRETELFITAVLKDWSACRRPSTNEMSLRTLADRRPAERAINTSPANTGTGLVSLQPPHPQLASLCSGTGFFLRHTNQAWRGFLFLLDFFFVQERTQGESRCDLSVRLRLKDAHLI